MKYYLAIAFLMNVILSSAQTYLNACFPEKNHEHAKKSAFHKTPDSYPDTIHVVGQIVGIKPGICGFLYIGDSIKVKLLHEIEKYPFGHIYLATGCGDVFVKKCKETVDFTVTKLVESNINQAYGDPINVYDTDEIPFYVISWKDLASIK